MAASRDDVLRAVHATFPEGRWPFVLEALDRYGVETYEHERERVQLAILTLAGGDERKLLEHVASAKVDYRDVLLWAESPEETSIDTAEKRQQIRELFDKLGVEPPPGLLD
jgi:hypothetical protein